MQIVSWEVDVDDRGRYYGEQPPVAFTTHLDNGEVSTRRIVQTLLATIEPP